MFLVNSKKTNLEKELGRMLTNEEYKLIVNSITSISENLEKIDLGSLLSPTESDEKAPVKQQQTSVNQQQTSVNQQQTSVNQHQTSVRSQSPPTLGSQQRLKHEAEERQRQQQRLKHEAEERQNEEMQRQAEERQKQYEEMQRREAEKRQENNLKEKAQLEKDRLKKSLDELNKKSQERNRLKDLLDDNNSVVSNEPPPPLSRINSMVISNHKQKYLKYKAKYLALKKSLNK